MSQLIELTVPEEEAGERLDRFIAASSLLEFSRSYIQKLIKNSRVTVDGGAARANLRLKIDQNVVIDLPKPEKLELVPQDIPLNIVYEDSDMLVINKQPGLVVHPGPGNHDSTLVNALLYHITDLSSIGGVERPGIVHRLDRDTSGLMLVAKNDKAHLGLSSQFADGLIEKYYSAVCIGRMPENPMIIEEPLGRHPKYRQKMTVVPGGRYAKTKVNFVKSWTVNNTVYSLCKIRIYTGRTHQIRVHLSSRGLPIVGDPVYSKSYAKYKLPYLLLAAVKISFTHPGSGQIMTFEAPLPEHITDFIKKCENA